MRQVLVCHQMFDYPLGLLLFGIMAIAPSQPLHASDTQALPMSVAAAIAMPVAANRVVLSEEPSAVGLTVPSLWWAVQQFGGTAVQRWQAYPAEVGVGGRVDVFISPPTWGRMSYLQRFALVNQLGNSSRSFGYNLILRDRRDVIYGAYTCNFEAVKAQYLPHAVDATGEPVPLFLPQTALDCSVWINPNIPVSLL